MISCAERRREPPESAVTDRDRPNEIETQHISASELARLHTQRRESAAEQRTALLLYQRDGVRVVPLVAGQPQVLGRFAPADIVVADGSLSRQHATVELREGALWVEDLQSTNGTWVNGKRVESGTVESSDELAFGAVVACCTSDPAGVGALALDSHDNFSRLLEVEVARAAAHVRTLALLMVRGERHLSHWLAAVQCALRPFDRLAMYSADTLEVLLPELTSDASLAIAAAIVREAPALRVGIAAFPENGRSAGALFEQARQALRNVETDHPVLQAGRSRASAVPTVATTSASQAVACSPAMQEVLASAVRYADAVIPVLIVGETGTGKEVVARAIHEQGPRRDQPLIHVNCGAIPAQLVESTLFGHERGAFTGAAQQARGVFESADHGSVLLDEVGELPEAAQAALLRVLETKRFCRVGSTREIAVDVRVLAATHRDLSAMCQAGQFRQDLLYRLNAATIAIPPLRERVADIAPLARHFVQLASRDNRRTVDKIDERVIALLEAHGWPGNARELRNVIERAVVIASRDLITVDDLPDALRGIAFQEPAPIMAAEPTVEGNGTTADINLRAELDRVERDLIVSMLRACNWDRSQAAPRLGLPLRTLARKIADLKIEKEE